MCNSTSRTVEKTADIWNRVKIVTRHKQDCKKKKKARTKPKGVPEKSTKAKKGQCADSP